MNAKPRAFQSPRTRPSSLNRPQKHRNTRFFGVFLVAARLEGGLHPVNRLDSPPHGQGPSVLRRLDRHEGLRGAAMALKWGENTENRIPKSTTSASFRFAKLSPGPLRGSHSQHGSLGEQRAKCRGYIQLPPRVAGLFSCKSSCADFANFFTLCRVSELFQLALREAEAPPINRSGCV